MNLDKKILEGIVALAKQYNIDKIMLFGSRARGDNTERSDIDLAVSGEDFFYFMFDIDQEIETLLKFDFVDLNSKSIDYLLKEVYKDGVVIYEKT